MQKSRWNKIEEEITEACKKWQKKTCGELLCDTAVDYVLVNVPIYGIFTLL